MTPYETSKWRDANWSSLVLIEAHAVSSFKHSGGGTCLCQVSSIQSKARYTSSFDFRLG